MKKYQSHAVRRQVRTVARTHDGHLIGKVYSLTKPGTNVQWHPTVDVQTGMVHCDCPDFFHRHGKNSPNVHTPQHHYKHITQYIAGLVRKGALVLTPVASTPVADLPRPTGPIDNFGNDGTPSNGDSIEFACVSPAYAEAIHREAVQRGYHAEWGRVPASVKYRVEVFEIDRTAFSNILRDAGRNVPAVR